VEAAVITTWIIMLIASILNTPATTILLGENGKKHNAIVVQTDAGSIVIDKPWQYVSLASKKDAPSVVKTMSKENIAKNFQTLQKAAPLKPIHVNLYFQYNSNDLTKESESKLPEILQIIQDRSPCDVSIIGHTDTKGKASYNEKLALKRAKNIKQWILSSDVNLINLETKSYGESDLLVKTKDNVSEPKNRRVEIFIK